VISCAPFPHRCSSPGGGRKAPWHIRQFMSCLVITSYSKTQLSFPSSLAASAVGCAELPPRPLPPSLTPADPLLFLGGSTFLARTERPLIPSKVVLYFFAQAEHTVLSALLSIEPVVRRNSRIVAKPELVHVSMRWWSITLPRSQSKICRTQIDIVSPSIG
jgi:hypothetical protein